MYQFQFRWFLTARKERFPRVGFLGTADFIQFLRLAYIIPTEKDGLFSMSSQLPVKPLFLNSNWIARLCTGDLKKFQTVFRKMKDISFNKRSSTKMHVDINSCFASIEQQANPFLRGRPVAVAAYTTSKGCILASSVEAKMHGVKTGMRVFEGKSLCPGLIVLPTDVQKYRNVHLSLKKLLLEFTSEVFPKSIDEFVLDFSSHPSKTLKMLDIGSEIKKRIKLEIGDFLTVSVGISTNRFLAKLASNLKKPDGLEEINYKNYRAVFESLSLTDLPGIKTRNSIRLNEVGIFSLVDFYEASPARLRRAFKEAFGYYWWLRLHGYTVDEVDSTRKTFGNSYALPRPLENNEKIFPILAKLTQKTGFRLRQAKLTARGVHLAISFRDRSFWHKGMLFKENFYTSSDIYRRALQVLKLCPQVKSVRDISVSVFGLSRFLALQLNIFEDEPKKRRLTISQDVANKRWGNFTLVPARMLFLKKGSMPDRIAFGGVKEIEETLFGY